jgi:hypothetical protein
MKFKITTIAALAVAITILGTAFVQAESTKPKINIREERMIKKDAIKDLRTDFKDERRVLMASSTMTKREIKASTTDMFKNFKDQRKELGKKMKKNLFENRLSALVKQLRITLENLTNIRGRVSDRIVNAEKAGRTMTTAKASLIIADEKLAKAKTAVDALASIKVSSTTADIELVKPRITGNAAIKAVKDARDALRNTNVDIAQNMGLGKTEDHDATTIATTTTATTTNAVATTTTATSTATSTSN